VLDQVRDLTKQGLAVGGKTYPVEILVRDNESSVEGAARAGEDLLVREKVDLLLMSTSEPAIHAAAMCDKLGVPGLSTMSPWQIHFFARGGKPDTGFPYTFHFFFGLDDLTQTYSGMWRSLGVRYPVGTFYFDNAAGRGMANPERGIPAAIRAAGLREVNAGFYAAGTTDFRGQIAQLKAGDAGILSGFAFPNDFAAFWAQAAELGFAPEVCSVPGAFLFPTAVELLGDRGDGMSTEVWWTPNVPFRSTLTGQTAAALATSFEAASGRQWTQPLGYSYALWEVAIAALKAAGDPHDREAVAAALARTRLDTIVGPVDFASTPVRSVARTQLAGGQWRRSDGGRFRYDLRIVANNVAPAIPVEQRLALLSKLS
jgi:branched-chain amino acid transport system substrate-binding protein